MSFYILSSVTRNKALLLRMSPVIQFKSFEEGLALIGALAATLIAYKLFDASTLASGVAGLGSAITIAYLTFFEFKLEGDVITYRNRFMQQSFPIGWVQKVSMRTHWGGLPGHIFYFLLRYPPAPWHGYSRRTGLVSWPSARKWVGAVNEAIRNT